MHARFPSGALRALSCRWVNPSSTAYGDDREMIGLEVAHYPDMPAAGHGCRRLRRNVEKRVSSVNDGMTDMKSSNRRLEETTGEEAKPDATLPHPATKAEIAAPRTEMVVGFRDKPSKTYMWGHPRRALDRIR